MEVALLRRNDRVRFGLAASQVWNTVPASHLKITHLSFSFDFGL